MKAKPRCISLVSPPELYTITHFWHNNFGEPMSRGCVNARPEDAKWVSRWTQPIVLYDPDDVTVNLPGGTKVEVRET
jgi:lipoprotein-anchoring transpeptidase ErfK/SrfK